MRVLVRLTRSALQAAMGADMNSVIRSAVLASAAFIAGCGDFAAGLDARRIDAVIPIDAFEMIDAVPGPDARPPNPWHQEAYVKASNTDLGDFFGMATSVSGDTIAVGAGSESSSATGIDGDQSDNSANASCAVYVLTRAGTTWSQQAYIKASNTEALDGFGGYAVSISGGTLAVGAYGE